MLSALSTASRLFSNTLKTYGILLQGKKIPMTHIDYEITDACNSKCQFCNVWQGKPSTDILKTDEIIRIFEEPFFKTLKSIIITGGEPFIRKDLNEILYGINKSIPGIIFALSSNGLLPERVIDTVKFCISKQIKFAVGISLDDVGERHDLLRGVAGNFNKVDYIVRELVVIRERSKYPFEIIVAHCLCDEGVESLPRVRKYAEERDVTFMTQVVEEFSFYGNINNGSARHTNNFNKNESTDISKTYLSSEEIIKIMNGTPSGLRTYKQRGEHSLKVNKKYMNNEPIIKSLESLPTNFHIEYLKNVLNGGTARFNCFSLRNFYFMKCNGDVTPCLRYAHVPVGNLRDTPASEVFYGEKAMAARKVIAKCDGCANTWATDWSMEASFLSFTKILLRSLMAKRKTRKCDEQDCAK